MSGKRNRIGLGAAAVVAIALASLGGCGGGGGGGGGGGSAPPPPPPPARFSLAVAVTGNGSVSSQPAGIDCGATCSAEVTTGTRVTLTASAAAGHSLQAWGGACSAASGSTCSVTVSQATSVTATFVAAPAPTGWSNPPTPLSAGASGSAKVAMDAAGRAVAVWLTLRAGTLIDDDLMASRFDPVTGWSTPEALETRLGDVTRFDLAMDPASGRAVVLWTQSSDTSNGSAWARHFEPATGWTPVQALSTPSGVVDVVSVGMDAQGNAVAAWSQLDGSRFSVWGSRGSAAGTWGTAQLLETMDELGRVDGNPRIAVAPQGDALVVWQASGGTLVNRGTWTNRYTAGGGWGTASQLVSVSGGSAPDIAMDANGNAVMVWAQIDAVSASEVYALIQAKRYQGGAWGAPLQVARELGANSVLSTVHVKMNAAGAALVAWGQGDQSIRATLAPAGGTWPTPSIVKPVGSRAATAGVRAAVNGEGNAFLAWSQGNDVSTSDTMLSSYTLAGGWVAGVPHDSIAEIATDPFIAMDERGNAWYLWTQYMGSSLGTQIVARRYVSGR
jgi:hypothetical protein